MKIKKYFYELMTDSRQGWFDQGAQGLLWVLSKVYAVVVDVTRGLYQDHLLPVYRAPKPVVSVGNITTGGVGKTPLVLWLVKILSQQGVSTVVLTRGYGSSNGLNDETRMFSEILPQASIAAGKNRKKSILKVLAKEKVDIFIADDAFQHWPLSRDLDIVVIDATNPFGNGHLIPRGILREKKNVLIRADIFVLSKTDRAQSTRLLHNELRQINSRALILESRHVFKGFRDIFTRKVQKPDALHQKRVLAFCAIGDPSSFEHTLTEAGVVSVKNFTFMDHHAYTQEDLKPILDSARQENVNILVTTHKDAVKITSFRNLFTGFLVLSLDIELDIPQGQDEIIKRILSLRRD